MKKVIGLAVAGLALASVAAYAAQMNGSGANDSSDMPARHAAMPIQHGGGQSMGHGIRHGDMRGHSEHGMQRGDTQTQQGHKGHGMRHGMMHGGMMQQGSGHGSGSHGTSSHGDSAQPKGDSGPSSLAFAGINRKMHEGMNIAFTGNADLDFVKGMIPHHQGAVEMAKTVVAFGKDPELRKLAEEIVKAQEAEIALMQAWLKKDGQ